MPNVWMNQVAAVGWASDELVVSDSPLHRVYIPGSEGTNEDIIKWHMLSATSLMAPVRFDFKRSKS